MTTSCDCSRCDGLDFRPSGVKVCTCPCHQPEPNCLDCDGPCKVCETQE